MMNEDLLNPEQDIYSCLGALCNNPDLLINSKVNLTVNDFVKNFHKVVFYAINNLIAENGTISENGSIKEITEFDIDTFLKQSDKYYLVWNKNDGINYISDAKELSNEDLFFQNYHSIKKRTILRYYNENGFSIKDILDTETTEPDVLANQQAALIKLREKDLIEHFNKKALNMSNVLMSNVESEVKYFKAGDNIENLMNNINQSPDFGYPFVIKYFNSLFGGMKKGKFLLRSTISGGGKSRQGIRDVLSISCKAMVDSKTNQWIELASPKPSMFITTELEQVELQKQMISFITKIPSAIINSGNYTVKIRDRIKKAIKILKEAPIYFVEMENFDIDDVKNEIERHILNFGVEYINFDYIQSTSKLNAETQKNYGRQMKDDQVLLELSKTLKDIAKNHNVFIESATQVNAAFDDPDVNISRTQHAIRGSKAIADKIDYGMVMAEPTSKDLKKLNLNKVDSTQKPTMSYWVYKNRNDRDGVVVWSNLNLGTMKEKILYITDYHYQPVDIDQTEIHIDEDGNFTTNDNIEV